MAKKEEIILMLMNKNKITDLADLLTACDVYSFRHDGSEYIVTVGTEERGYGRDGGGGCAFAYAVEDVSAWLTAWEDGTASYAGEDCDETPYQSFCEDVSALADRDLAIAMATLEGWRLTEAGSCQPVLADDEFRSIREAS